METLLGGLPLGDAFLDADDAGPGARAAPVPGRGPAVHGGGRATVVRKIRGPTASTGQCAHAALAWRDGRRPSLFGVAELDNVVADGGLAQGAVHVVEAASGGPAEEIARHMEAAAAFAAGFGHRSRGDACWLGPPADLLGHGAMAPGGEGALPMIETCWDGRPGVSLAAVPARVLVLDVRRAHRLSLPVRLARAALKQGRTVVLLMLDAARVAGLPEFPPICWRIGQADMDADVARRLWQVELTRGEAVRRVLVSACDREGRMVAAPRLSANGGKEMMRRFARA